MFQAYVFTMQKITPLVLILFLVTPPLALAQEIDELPFEQEVSEQQVEPTVNTGMLQLDGVAAVVNDGIVLQSQLAEELRNIRQRITASGTQLPPQDILVPQVLERLVIQEIQLQRAARTGIQISDEELNEALSSIAQRNGIFAGATTRNADAGRHQLSRFS